MDSVTESRIEEGFALSQRRRVCAVRHLFVLTATANCGYPGKMKRRKSTADLSQRPEAGPSSPMQKTT